MEAQEGKLKFAETLTSGLETMLSSGNHADVTIVVDGKVFPCHKVVLCAMSPYFDAMFSTDMIETRGGIVTLYDILPTTFEIMLKFLYTGDDIVTQDNAEQVFKASSMLQIPCLQERCEDFLLTQVTDQNCIGIWKIARAQNCQRLSKKALFTVLSNFIKIVNCPDVQKLDSEELLMVIGSDMLCVPNEEMLCDTVIMWIKYDLDNRKRYMKDFLAVLRLPLLSPDYLFSILDDPSLDVQGEAINYVKEAFKYHLCPAKRPEFSSDRFLQRQQSGNNDCLVVVGGLLKTVPRFQTTKEVICYSFQQEQWFNLPPLPYDPGYEFAVCVHGRDIYLSGGWLKLPGFAVYKGGKNKWKVSDSMEHGRCGHAMVALTNYMYVLGGRDGVMPAMTNIEMFNMQTKRWEIAGELILGIRSMSATVVDEKIFLFGGITENDRDSAKVQCFDTRLSTSTIIGELPFACRLTRTVTCDGTVYIILPDGRILNFDCASSRKRIESLSEFSFSSDNEDENYEDVSTLPESATLPYPTSPKAISTEQLDKDGALGRVIGKIQSFNQHHFEAVQHRGCLLLAGGKTPDNTILKNILFVNPDDSKTLSEIEMPSSRWCFGVSKIVVSTEYLKNAIGSV